MDRVDCRALGGEHFQHEPFGDEHYVVLSRQRSLRSAEVAFEWRQRKLEHHHLAVVLA
jgi:hypothetical protein